MKYFENIAVCEYLFGVFGQNVNNIEKCIDNGEKV